MAWRQLLDGVQARLQEFSQQGDDLRQTAEAAGQQIYCGPNCSNCCSLTVNCSYPEALLLAGNLLPEQRQAVTDRIPELLKLSRQAPNLKEFLQLFQQQPTACPLLHQPSGNCAVYPLRPFSCRALLSTRNSSWCGVDLSALPELEKQLYLSSLNPEVVAYPTHYLAASQELGRKLETEQLQRQQESFGLAVSGNLIFLLWLELEYQFSSIVATGIAAVESLLAKERLEFAYLLEIQAAVSTDKSAELKRTHRDDIKGS